MQIGGNAAGNITIASPIANLALSNFLSLINNGSISETALGSLAIPNLRISSTGPVTLNNPNNNIQVLAASATNALTVNDGTNTLTVGTVDGVTGIVTNNSAINLTADNMNIIQQVNAGTGIVTLAPFTALANDRPRRRQCGGYARAQRCRTRPGHRLGAAGRCHQRQHQRHQEPITRHAGYNTLSLATGGNINRARRCRSPIWRSPPAMASL